MPSTKTKVGFIADPIHSFNPFAETTFFMMNEAQRRGFAVLVCELNDLSLQNNGVSARMCNVKIKKRGQAFSYRLSQPQKISLQELDILFLRKDPPVDEVFLNHLSLLEVLEQKSCRPILINRPSGIKKANEKIYPLQFTGISPPTLVSFSQDDLKLFVKQHKKVVVKPLNASGGSGIFILESKNPSQNSLLEMATHNFSQYILLQAFLPQASRGDKRVLLFNGKPLGSFLRVPSGGDFRGNMHRGARWVKAVMTPHEKRIVENLAPSFMSDGLHFVGLDFIGPYVTEINTTSPMGIREINKLYGKKVEKEIFDEVKKMV